jgi:hypothetical protein
VAATAAVPLLVFDWSNAQLVGALWGYARLKWYPGQPAMEALEQQVGEALVTQNRQIHITDTDYRYRSHNPVGIKGPMRTC